MSAKIMTAVMLFSITGAIPTSAANSAPISLQAKTCVIIHRMLSCKDPRTGTVVTIGGDLNILELKKKLDLK